MAVELFTVEGGLKIIDYNGDGGPSILKGTDLPGLLAQENEALQASIYCRANGETYTKKLAGSGTDKWVRLVNQDDLNGISPRSEKIITATNDVAPTSGTDFTLPFSDDDNSNVTTADFQVGEYVLFDVDGTPKLMEVTAIGTGTIECTDATAPLADNDYMIVQKYLPDSPDDQEKQALLQYVDGTIVKIADFNWNFADGIGLAAGYAAGAGDVNATDTVQTAIQKIDGVNDAQDTTLGVAQGAVHLGTFTGTIISDNNSVKGALQELETDLDALQTLSGRPAGAVDNGTFTGDVISDNVTTKVALQELETEIETINTQRKLTGVTTETTLDEVLVDDEQACKWLVTMSLDSAPERIMAKEIFGVHNGSATSDATATDKSVYAKLKIGIYFNASVTIDLDGTGATQKMRLRVSATNAVTFKARRVSVDF